ncbi:Dabb family protein [Rhodohalobacter sp. SW132]|uniref:Dabb family protein n=1 Tax=Rhodohalobacter sp. SW132 TaxID=2293433 RepID=UPI00131552F6|nr:Dabb family protein [Rhodohalobacter sp. SW132]
MNTLIAGLLLTVSFAMVVPVQAQSSESDTEQALVHTVFFWFNDDVSEEDHSNFYEELKKLMEIDEILHGWIGVPAATEERGVIDNTYDYSITFVFEDEAAEHEYQVHPIHQEFIEKNAHLWADVTVYDAVTPGE